VCDQFITKYLNNEFKEDRYFVNEVKTQSREKPLRDNQIQDIHYLENKAKNKAITLTYPDAAIVRGEHGVFFSFFAPAWHPCGFEKLHW
jgi:hypothetical protein